MLRSVVDHVASLAGGREVGVRVVRGIVVPMSSSQNYPCQASLAEYVGSRFKPDPPAPAVTLPTSFCIPPAAITEVVDHPPVRSPAALAAASSPHEPDHS